MKWKKILSRNLNEITLYMYVYVRMCEYKLYILYIINKYLISLIFTCIWVCVCVGISVYLVTWVFTCIYMIKAKVIK